MKAWIVFCLTILLSSLVVVRADADADASGAKASTGTDAGTIEREAEAMSNDGFSAKELEEIASTGEKHQFQAEVNRLMDIIINSLYSNREIFLRELISNSADALDKIRFRSLTKPELLDDDPLDIKIKFDKQMKTLTITDNGIGMTKDQLIQDLGVVAKSGTSDFLDAAISGGTDSMSLIGQFGVGFYSVYLVADKVTVVSKHNDDDQHVWESTANSVFTVAKDPRGNTLGQHGTEITLHLKEDAEEFLNEGEIEKFVKKYSQYINFPISLWTTRTETEEVPVEEEEEEEAVVDDEEEDTDAEGDDDLDISEEDDEDEPKPKTRSVEKEVTEWKRLNDVKAIWTRSPKEISEEEYIDFYKSLSKDDEGPSEKVHFVAEGEITFRSILYIPKKAPPGIYDRFYDKATNIKLFVRKVMISEEFDDFLPKYLNFVRGVVDSDDLPLNVSRETLAQSRVLKVMSKKIVRKVLEMLRKMAEREEDDEDEDEDEDEEEEEGGEEKEDGETEETDGAKEGKEDYANFWKEFGKSIKMGIIQDRKNKSKLAKLLRFVSSKSEDDAPVSLESYVDRMKDDQKKIYYITGENLDIVKTCPAVEKLLKKDYEVLFMSDSLDEYVLQQLSEFDGVSLQSAAKEDLKFGNEDSDSFKELEEEFKPLTDWLKTALEGKVEKVKVSNRLTTTPAVLVSSQYGWSGNMERVMKSQALGKKDASYQSPKKTFEINVRHPIITALKEKVEADGDDQGIKDISTLLYDTALLQNGFLMEEPKQFSDIINRVVSLGLKLDPNAEVGERPVVDESEEEEETEEEETEEAEAEAEAESESADEAEE